MTKAEATLAQRLFLAAAEQYSNHGCNDLDSAYTIGLSEAEKNDIEVKWNQWNSGGAADQWVQFSRLDDDSLMHYLATRIEPTE